MSETRARLRIAVSEEPTSPLLFGACCVNPSADPHPPRREIVRDADDLTRDPAPIIAAVSAEYGFPVVLIKSSTRSLNLSEARHVAYWLMRKLTKLSYPEIARAMGKRDHAMALEAFRELEKRQASDPGFRKRMGRLVEEITGRAAA